MNKTNCTFQTLYSLNRLCPALVHIRVNSRPACCLAHRRVITNKHENESLNIVHEKDGVFRIIQFTILKIEWKMKN